MKAMEVKRSVKIQSAKDELKNNKKNKPSTRYDHLSYFALISNSNVSREYSKSVRFIPHSVLALSTRML